MLNEVINFMLGSDVLPPDDVASTPDETIDFWSQ